MWASLWHNMATEFLLLDIKYTCEARWSGLNRVVIVRQEKTLDRNTWRSQEDHRRAVIGSENWRKNRGRAKTVCETWGRPEEQPEWMESVNDQARVPAPPTTVHGARCFIILTFLSKLRFIELSVRIQIVFDWTWKKAKICFIEDIFWLNLEILYNRSVIVCVQILDTHNTMTVLYHYKPCLAEFKWFALDIRNCVDKDYLDNAQTK